MEWFFNIPSKINMIQFTVNLLLFIANNFFKVPYIDSALAGNIHNSKNVLVVYEVT